MYRKTNRRLALAILAGLLLPLMAHAAHRLVPGKTCIEGIVIHHERIDKMGILYNVGTFFEAFIPVEGFNPEVQAKLEAMCRPHAEGDVLPASIVLNAFHGRYDVQARMLTVKAIRPAFSFRLNDDQVDLVQKFFRGRAMQTGSQKDRAALQQLIESGQMKEYVHEVVRLVNEVRPSKR